MKKQNYFKTIFLLLLFSINLSAQVPAYVPTNGLVGWWPFTGNANDLSGNGNNGTNNGATLTTDRYSNNNSAYYFNGASQIDISGPITSASTGNNQATISTWFFIPTIHNINSYLVGYGNPNQQNGQIFAIGEDGSNGIYSTFYGGPFNAISNIAYPLNSWHNITVVKGTNGLVSFYLDAILIYSQTVSTPNIGNNSGRFGRALWNSPEFFLGKLDDIGIWNRALSPAEITALYNAVSCVAPIASITTQGNSTFCAGGSCTLNANAGNSYTYQWYNNGTIINGATNISYIGTQTGNYTVKVTDGLTSCFTTSQPQSVNVNPLPNVSFGFLASFVCIRTAPINLLGSPNGGTYQGPGISGSAFSPTVAGLGNKNLKYTYTDNNGCSNFANQSVIIYDTIICPTVSGIIKNSEDLLNEESVKIYPNPNQGFFNLELTECKNSIIKITDVLGKTILNQKAELFNEIDLKNQSSGVYTINIITDKKIKYSTKVIKE